jgi:peptidoglycan/xylan/chitin deacetylase (PgdA/CDA1 family)
VNRQARRDVLVLCYHAISPTWTASLSVTPAQFERQITHLLQHGWEPTTFSDAVTGTGRGRILAITFDDAFRSVMVHAEPILRRLAAPATVFAPTDFMDGFRRLEWPGVAHWLDTGDREELAAMSWEELRSLLSTGWEIGSHTCSHPRLTRLDDAALGRELAVSQARCAGELGRVCDSIAYPYGDVDDRVTLAALRAGYRLGARLSSDLGDQGAIAFPRMGIYHEDDWWRFRLKVSWSMRRLRATAMWPARSR